MFLNLAANKTSQNKVKQRIHVVISRTHLELLWQFCFATRISNFPSRKRGNSFNISIFVSRSLPRRTTSPDFWFIICFWYTFISNNRVYLQVFFHRPGFLCGTRTYTSRYGKVKVKVLWHFSHFKRCTRIQIDLVSKLGLLCLTTVNKQSF